MSLDAFLYLIVYSTPTVLGLGLAIILSRMADKSFKAEMSKKH